jgi:uncharacterized protein
MDDSFPALAPTRRALFKTVLTAAAAAGLPAVLTGCTGRPGLLTVAGGEPGGFYLEFSTLLAAALERHGVADRAEAVSTGGSLDNLAELRGGRATFAVALADAAAAAPEPGTEAVTLAALGKVYENYVHCVVRRDSGIVDLSQLAGRTVAVGQPGSGTSLTTPRILAAAGLDTRTVGGTAADGTVAVVSLGLNDGLAALKAGTVDALFWSGGVPTAAVAAAQQEVPLALLDLSALLPELRKRHGAVYDRVLIPEGSYPGVPAVWTVGAANLLLCRTDLDAATVERTVQLLVHHAGELIPQSSLGVQFLSPETLINTAGIPLHPAAADAYRALHG